MQNERQCSVEEMIRKIDKEIDQKYKLALNLDMDERDSTPQSDISRDANHEGED